MTFTLTHLPDGTRLVSCDHCRDLLRFRLDAMLRRFKSDHVALHSKENQR